MEAPEGRQLDHKHILVVDDESQITRVLRTSLSSHGYDIRVANDGETALEIMKDWTPDLVISDLSMPAIAAFNQDSDYRALGQGRGKNQSTSTGCWRRRLRHQAVRHRRVAGAR